MFKISKGFKKLGKKFKKAKNLGRKVFEDAEKAAKSSGLRKAINTARDITDIGSELGVPGAEAAHSEIERVKQVRRDVIDGFGKAREIHQDLKNRDFKSAVQKSRDLRDVAKSHTQQQAQA